MNRTKKECSEKYERETASSGQKDFFICNKHGVVTIIGIGNSERIKIRGRKTVRAETLEEAKSHLADIDIDIQDVPNEFRIRTRHPDGRHGLEYQVDYEIELPSEWSPTIENINGNIRVSDVKNKLKICLHNGTVDARNILADVHVEILNGNIRVEQNLPQNGLCLLSTVNGTINLFLNKDASAVVSASVTTGAVCAEGLGGNSKPSRHDGFRCTLNDGKGTVNLSTVNGTICIGYL